jgi:hypothetical protein
MSWGDHSSAAPSAAGAPAASGAPAWMEVSTGAASSVNGVAGSSAAGVVGPLDYDVGEYGTADAAADYGELRGGGGRGGI